MKTIKIYFFIIAIFSLVSCHRIGPTVNFNTKELYVEIEEGYFFYRVEVTNHLGLPEDIVTLQTLEKGKKGARRVFINKINTNYLREGDSFLDRFGKEKLYYLLLVKNEKDTMERHSYNFNTGLSIDDTNCEIHPSR